MPELPEVETIARTLAPQVTGRAILAAHVLHAKTLEAGKDLFPVIFPGAVITAARRRAKLLLLDLRGRGGEPYTLAFHLKMTGRLFVHGADAQPHKHTRMVFDLSEAEAETGAKPKVAPAGAVAGRLFFDDVRTFGYCRLLRPQDFAVWPFWNKLGPEPLTLAPQDFIDALLGRRGAVKALLLDQTIIAGIGNIYADEACFRAGLRPDAPASKQKPEKLAVLLGHIKDVLNESIEECGSSIRDYRDANGDAGAFQNRFKVYGRAGQACTVCGKTLAKTVVAGRTTVYCGHCQK